MRNTVKVDQFIEVSLSQLQKKIEESFGGEVIFVYGAIDRELGDAIHAEIETLKKHKEKISKRLVVVIETPGGCVDAAERICNLFRRSFEIVDFIIPNYAYSAGTALVLSGDSIHMDYYSVLGLTYPQPKNGHGQWASRAVRLQAYNRLIEKSEEGNLTEAELFLLIKNFDPADMLAIKREKERLQDLIKKWLVEYKFKNWTKTQTNGKSVTLQMKRERAEKVASALGDEKRWFSCGRNMTMQALQDEGIHLTINDYRENEELGESIYQYYSFLKDCYLKENVKIALHSANGFTCMIQEKAMTNIQDQRTIRNNKSKNEENKSTDCKGGISVRLPHRLEKLSKQVDRIRHMEGDESMFRSRLRLPYSSPDSARLRKNHQDCKGGISLFNA